MKRQRESWVCGGKQNAYAQGMGMIGVKKSGGGTGKCKLMYGGNENR